MLGSVRGSRRVLPCLFACIAAIAAVAAMGCGDDESKETPEKPQIAAAKESAKTYVARTIKLIETTERKQDCAQLDVANQRSFFRPSCPPPKALRESMASFKLLGVEEYGTGAVADYRSGAAKDGASIVLFVGPGRDWGISRFGVFSSGTVGTSDEESRDGFDEALEGYLDAVRKRDCAAFIDHAATDSKGKQICHTEFAATETLARKLKANPKAEPAYQGGNEMFGFYTLETKKPDPENLTISTIKAADQPADRYLVLTVAPSPTAAEQRRVRRQIAKQQREQERSTTSQSPMPDN